MLTGYAEGRLGVELQLESPRRSFGKEGESCDTGPTARGRRVNVWGSERVSSNYDSSCSDSASVYRRKERMQWGSTIRVFRKFMGLKTLG